MWLIIVLVVGTLIILLECTLETIVIWLERHKFIKTSSTEWFSNDTFQLQRMAHEELGLGNWESCRGKVIPVTHKGQLLGIFDATDPEHPRLVNPSGMNQKPDGARNNESSNQGAVGDGCGTDVNESSPSGASQDNGQDNASPNSARHNRNDDNGNSLVENPNNRQSEDDAASPSEG